MNDDDLLNALRALPRETQPPAGLEERIAARLRERRRRPVRFALAAALAAATFLGGYAAGRTRGEPTHVLLVHAMPSTPAQSRARVAEYGAWARNLAGGEKLTSDAWLLEGSRVEADVPAISGYFLLRARDDAEALRVARTCPHLRYGGRVELRRVQR